MNQPSMPLLSVLKNKEEIFVTDVSRKQYVFEELSLDDFLFQNLNESLRKNEFDKFTLYILKKLLSFINESILNNLKIRSPSLVSREIRKFLDSLSGFINISYLGPQITFHDAPRFYHFSCAAFQKDPKDDKEVNIWGSGVSLYPEEAIKKSIYECIERILFSSYKKENFRLAKIKELDQKFDPLNFKFFADFQYQKESLVNHKVSENSLLYWLLGKDLFTEENIWIPAQLVYWNYKLEEFEPRLWDINSNGEALGSSFQQALVNAIYELIERDSFMICWLKKIVPKRINLKTINDKEIIYMLEKFERYNLDLNVCKLDNEFGLNVYLAVIRDFTGVGPAVTISASCHLDKMESIKKAILEATKVYHYTRYLMRTNKEPQSSFLGQKERLLLWSQKKMLSEIDWLLEGEIINENFSQKNFLGFKQQLDYLKTKLKESQIRCFFVDITPKSLKKKNLWAIRAISPDLVPLHLKEEFVHLGVKRLYKHYERSLLNSKDDFNTLPHPFS
jgi:ribosomal protein S12 methylthiotransferase accessory factor